MDDLIHISTPDYKECVENQNADEWVGILIVPTERNISLKISLKRPQLENAPTVESTRILTTLVR